MTDPLSISASIIAILELTSTVTQYLKDVKDGSEDRARISSEMTSVTSILFLLREQAREDKQNASWTSTFQSLNVEKGPLDQIRMALERLSKELAPGATRLRKVGKAMSWPFKKAEIEEILGIIERAKALLILARQNDHIKLSEAIKCDTTLFPLIRDEVQQIAVGVSDIRTSQITSNHWDIINWLDGPDPSTNYNKALKDRNSKTGSWFVESSTYADWTTTRGSFLWLHGIPGCGKTILSSTIIEKVLNQHSTKPNSAVLFFYFDFNDAEKQRHEKMIRSLICQLSKYCKTSLVQDLYLSCSNGSRQPTGDVLLNALHQMMASLGDIYIILDALDECTERNELFEDLETVISWKDVNLHVIVTSRMEKDIDEALTPLINSRNRIGIQSTRVDDDIRTYIHDRLQVDRKLKRWQKDTKVQGMIEDTLMRKADGMFRWAACQLDILGDCFNVRHLQQALVSLPKTLDDTYARILVNIDQRHNQYSREILKILQWLTFSARPLRLRELAEIIAIDADESPRFDADRRWPEPRDILTICSSLITITNYEYEARGNQYSEDLETYRMTGVPDSDGSMVFVRLAHFSVKEYLVSNRMQQGIAAHYSVKEIESHGVLAQDCIAYLLQFDEPGSLTSETLKLSPLARYAAKHWTQHARQAGKGPIETTLLLSMELLLSDGEGLLSWVRIAKPDGIFQNLELRSDNLAPPIYYASQAGLFEQVKILIDNNVDFNAQGGKYGHTLQAASCCGHTDIVQILLDSGADINAQGGSYGNALQAASESGHLDIVQILLDSGADINAQGGYYTTLQAASDSGHLDIVQILLDNGADVNAQGNQGSALRVASSVGHENIVKILLDEGADVNAQSDGLGALQDASYYGQENIVKMLLDKGADVNAQSDEFGTALQIASKNGHENIVKMLLDKGVDVNAQSDEHWTALQYASRNGYERIVKMLLDKGADVNAQSDEHWTALQDASYEGHENIMKMLLNKGADINATGGKSKMNALHRASSQGHEIIVSILIDRGTDVNAQGGMGWSALHLASWYGYENVVKILLEKEADINATGDEDHTTSLELALENGHENIANILLAKGAVMPEEEIETSEKEAETSEEQVRPPESEQQDNPPHQQVDDLVTTPAPATAD